VSENPRGDGESTGEPGAEMRLDSLASAAGVATTTIRLYQQRGLLPGPRLEGRTGWYGPVHLARLRLIARLQQQGFSLAGIGTLLESWEEGRDLADLVGMEAQLDALLHRRVEVVLEPAELAERFPPGAVTPDMVQRALALGLVEPTDDGRLRFPDARFLEVGSDLTTMGVPSATVLGEWEHLVQHTDDIAERFVAVFEDHLLPEDWRDDLDSAGAAHLAGVLAKLVDHAGRVVLAALDASVTRVAGERLGELVDDVAPRES